jgi:hypothetical protein
MLYVYVSLGPRKAKRSIQDLKDDGKRLNRSAFTFKDTSSLLFNKLVEIWQTPTNQRTYA